MFDFFCFLFIDVSLVSSLFYWLWNDDEDNDEYPSETVPSGFQYPSFVVVDKEGGILEPPSLGAVHSWSPATRG